MLFTVSVAVLRAGRAFNYCKRKGDQGIVSNNTVQKFSDCTEIEVVKVLILGVAMENFNK